MTVYVDDMQRPASSAPSPTDHEGTHREHFDLTSPVRLKALDLGAEPLGYPRGTGKHIASKRETYVVSGGAAR